MPAKSILSGLSEVPRLDRGTHLSPRNTVWVPRFRGGRHGYGGRSDAARDKFA
jgi:hypothetical protein